MPVYLSGEPDYVGTANIINVSYEYDYPKGLDLKPGSVLHEKIRAMVIKKARQSRDAMRERYSSWRKIDRTLTAYVPVDKKKGAEEDKTQAEPIVIPVSFAVLETLLTYLVAAFLDSPIFRYDGVGPEDKIGAILLSKVIETHCRRAKVGLNLHTMFRDSLVYGFGAVTPTWYKETRKVTRMEEDGFYSADGQWIKIGEKKRVKEIKVEGNKLDNIDPYMYFPDPDIPVYDVQKGRSQGWIERTNRMLVLSNEQHDKRYFNAKYLKHISCTSSLYDEGRGGSGRESTSGINLNSSTTRDIADIIHMYIDLIPKDWGIGDSEYPEKWLFDLVGDAVVVYAAPLNLDHGKYPIAVCAPDFDGYSISPISRLETVYGMQEQVDWLMRSRLANVKKSLNDMLIVDPLLININDLMSPEPGKIIRTRKSIWGQGVEHAVKQLQVNDVTQSHIGDIQFLSDVIQRISAASDSLQGIVKKGGERTSATEARDTRSSALSRLEKSAKISSMQAMYEIGYMFASHTQQLMTQNAYVKSLGEWEAVLKAEYGEGRNVSPFDLMVDFDVVPHDGSMPGGEYADAWIQLYQILSTQPQVAAQFDMVRIFKHIARMLGAKNVNDFVNKEIQQAKVMSDEQVAQQAQAGNLVPAGESGLL